VIEVKAGRTQGGGTIQITFRDRDMEEAETRNRDGQQRPETRDRAEPNRDLARGDDRDQGTERTGDLRDSNKTRTN
jgi:hypothetical protein